MVQAQALLMRIHAWKLVTRRELRPTDQERAKDWEKRAEKATGEIFLRLDSANRDAVVDDLDNPVHMWEKLQRHHEDKSSLRRFNAYEDLFNIRKKEDESLVALGTRINEVMLRIKNLRPPSFDLTSLDDELVCMTMLRALPEEYHHLSTSLQLADKLDKSTLLQAFITEDINQKRRVESGSSPVASALSAVAAATVCAFCSLPGHSIESCYRFCEAKASASKEAQEKRQKRQEGGRKRS